MDHITREALQHLKAADTVFSLLDATGPDRRWLELLLGRPCEAWRGVSMTRAGAVPHEFQCASVVSDALIAKAFHALPVHTVGTHEVTRSLPALQHALQWPPPPLNGHKEPESSTTLLERIAAA